MKEATGELNMTVVTLIAIAAIGALFYAFIWPMIQRTIVQQTCSTYGENYYAFKDDTRDKDNNEKTNGWKCCTSTDKGATASTNCVPAN